jgi:hypothetical protein
VAHQSGVDVPRVGHAEKTLAGVLELEVLIRELLAIDRFTASAITFCEVAVNVN